MPVTPYQLVGLTSKYFVAMPWIGSFIIMIDEVAIGNCGVELVVAEAASRHR
jgi:hypothetical protein